MRITENSRTSKTPYELHTVRVWGSLVTWGKVTRRKLVLDVNRSGRIINLL